MVLINGLQFKQHYEKLISDLTTPAQAKKGHLAASTMVKLLCKLDSSGHDSSSDDNVGPSEMPADPARPWLKEFNQYLNMIDELSDGQALFQWWGVSTCVISVNLFHN